MYRWGSLVVALSIAAVQPVGADTVLTFRPSAQVADTKESKILGVDRHDVLLLDVSDSMDDEDIEALLHGVISHYSSDDAMADYRAGICTANTLVFYANSPYALKTTVICGQEDLNQFAADIGSIDIYDIRGMTGRSTDLVDAMDTALIVFQSEQQSGIWSGARSVVVVGDQIGGSIGDLKARSSMLTDQYQATVSAVSIRTPLLAGVFRHSVRTNEDAAKMHSIRAGIVGGASSAEEVRVILQNVLAFHRG